MCKYMGFEMILVVFSCILLVIGHTIKLTVLTLKGQRK